MSRKELKQYDFEGLGISPGLLDRIHKLGFKHPTPIQHKVIPVATSGEDVVGIAQTGSGKTLAYSIPMLQQISKTNRTGLVLLPTRELAVQVEETLLKVAGKAGLRTALVIGGAKAGRQINQIKANPHVIVATPGRLIDFMDRKIVSLSSTGVLVLDEADRMLDMGFAPQMKMILEKIPTDRQTMLFSATMPEAITSIANQYMKKPLRIEIAKPGTTSENVDQEVIIVPKEDKLDLLINLLDEYKGSVLIFSRTKFGAKKIARKLRQMKHLADEIHSNRTQNQRQKALKGFADGTHRILVATDIAARGIDVDDVQLVVNFDLPDQAEDYVHRIGRTARAGKSGKAISFAAPEQKRDIGQIERLINIKLPLSFHSDKAKESFNNNSGGYSSNYRGRNNNYRGRKNGRNRFSGHKGGYKQGRGRGRGRNNSRNQKRSNRKRR